LAGLVSCVDFALAQEIGLCADEEDEAVGAVHAQLIPPFVDRVVGSIADHRNVRIPIEDLQDRLVAFLAGRVSDLKANPQAPTAITVGENAGETVETKLSSNELSKYEETREVFLAPVAPIRITFRL
jgi:hypothetical protein